MTNCHSIFPSGSNMFSSHQPCLNFQHLHILINTCHFFSIFIIWMHGKWYLIVVLICIFVMMSKWWSLFHILFAICTYLEKVLLKFFAHLKITLVFLGWVVSVFIFLIIPPQHATLGESSPVTSFYPEGLE